MPSFTNKDGQIMRDKLLRISSQLKLCLIVEPHYCKASPFPMYPIQVLR